eukprot:gene8616-biopygen22647
MVAREKRPRPRPSRVRFFEFYRTACVRSTSTAVFPAGEGGDSFPQPQPPKRATKRALRARRGRGARCRQPDRPKRAPAAEPTPPPSAGSAQSTHEREVAVLKQKQCTAIYIHARAQQGRKAAARAGGTGHWRGCGAGCKSFFLAWGGAGVARAPKTLLATLTHHSSFQRHTQPAIGVPGRAYGKGVYSGGGSSRREAPLPPRSPANSPIILKKTR